MLAHDELRTLTIEIDWNLPLINQLKNHAILYEDGGWFEGDWERLEALAVEILQHFKGEYDLTRRVRSHFNTVVLERQKHDFALAAGDVSGGEELWRAQQALVDELLDFYADPAMFIIVHAIDPHHGDEAWLLCYLEDIQA